MGSIIIIVENPDENGSGSTAIFIENLPVKENKLKKKFFLGEMGKGV